MYQHTADELSVGGYVSFQALISVITAYVVGRVVTPRTRRSFMWWGVATLVTAGALMAFQVTVTTLLLFGLLRSVSGPLFGVPYGGLRYDIIANCADDPAQRIEYLAAWEVPLAIGRVLMMLLMMFIYTHLGANDFALRVILFLVCAIRVLTYQFSTRTATLRDAEKTA
jgi:YQGE family putative transporter